MPGRIWSLWISQALEGVFCCLLGLTTSGMALEEIPASNTAGRCVLLLSVFSIFVQMAEGGTYAIVPQVSRSALGVVSGIVGAGGNLGSVVTTAAFFASSDARTDDSFIKMGLAIVASSCLCALLYWPDEACAAPRVASPSSPHPLSPRTAPSPAAQGGALLGPRALGRFNPQLVLPPEGYGGADVIDPALPREPPPRRAAPYLAPSSSPSRSPPPASTSRALTPRMATGARRVPLRPRPRSPASSARPSSARCSLPTPSSRRLRAWRSPRPSCATRTRSTRSASSRPASQPTSCAAAR